MFDLRYLVLAIVAAALLPISNSYSIELDDMVNRTVCAIKVKYDIDRHRIPKRIKIIKCAAHTDQVCVANNIKQQDCCHHNNDMECVEMTDTVLVYNKTRKATTSIEVSVGCACMIRGAGQPQDVNSLEQSGR